MSGGYLGSDVCKLNDQELIFTCFCINKFGSEGHPIADNKGLRFFGLDYVLDCIKSAQHSTRLNEMGTDLCHDIYEKLSN